MRFVIGEGDHRMGALGPKKTQRPLVYTAGAGSFRDVRSARPPSMRSCLETVIHVHSPRHTMLNAKYPGAFISQVALASSRGAETYERALLEGREVPNVSMTSGTRPGGR